MPFYNTSNVRVYYDTVDIGTAMTSFAVNLLVEPLDPTALTDLAERALAGRRSDTFSYAGLFSDGTSLDSAGTMLGTNTRVMSVYLGTGTGSVGYAGTVLFMMSGPQGAIRDLIRQEGAWKPDQAWDRVLVLAPKTTTATGTFNGGPIDNTNTSTAGGTAYYHLFVNTGSATAKVTIQDSTTATGVYVDLATATVTAGTVTSGVLTWTGTTRRFVRAQFISATTGTITAAAAFRRVPDV